MRLIVFGMCFTFSLFNTMQLHAGKVTRQTKCACIFMLLFSLKTQIAPIYSICICLFQHHEWITLIDIRYLFSYCSPTSIRFVMILISCSCKKHVNRTVITIIFSLLLFRRHPPLSSNQDSPTSRILHACITDISQMIQVCKEKV